MSRVCGAKARSNNHQPCRRIAMTNGRCHLHGGLTPKHNKGPKTEQGRQRQRMSNWKHGFRSKEAREEARLLRNMVKEGKQLIADI